MPVVGAFLEWAFLSMRMRMWGSAWLSHQVLMPRAGFEAEVFPGPPDCFHADEGFGVFVPLRTTRTLRPR
jgi:hypothetical protein